ncbi:TIGR03620 family F420-dependent LLM class oxidoreductase [Mycolicibacterium goodii]|uniref:TIGR03620 family F420-dependent LLM class oxidoreductase n=1 Tax=Mycolicibacterium goodii TaxID=134601 RepID=UPI001BDC4E60|nr:TIGR03620 family F420-dependent LLM class oxidoreductase [Mycolicibacterium goodii]MBU8812532.1 TIGR03620 family F420-dependent LLM class oxidoreductase [Mycolicibacterium goodii]ULN46480.1 TIGR03620 family F420-dependent LLM class oxidoreductase [Mycolicibacterium goodii]
MHEQFGTYGAWLNPALGDAPRIDYAPLLEDLGYQTIWVGIGADPVGDLALLEQMVAATKNAIIATAIINMWQDDPRCIAHHYHRIVDRHGPRLLLGIGLGHPETRATYERPFELMANYVGALVEGSVPAEAIVIGALGRRTLTLAGEKTLGAHPYLTVPSHTRYAREMLGSSAFLAPEHKVVLTEDDAEARRIGRCAVQNPYLGLRNYTNNLMRHGFTEADVEGSGSDALVDALVAHGSPETIYTQIDQHLAAGANHVGIQVLTEHPNASPIQAFRALAEHRPAQ